MPLSNAGYTKFSSNLERGVPSMALLNESYICLQGGESQPIESCAVAVDKVDEWLEESNHTVRNAYRIVLCNKKANIDLLTVFPLKILEILHSFHGSDYISSVVSKSSRRLAYMPCTLDTGNALIISTGPLELTGDANVTMSLWQDCRGKMMRTIVQVPARVGLLPRAQERIKELSSSITHMHLLSLILFEIIAIALEENLIQGATVAPILSLLRRIEDGITAVTMHDSASKHLQNKIHSLRTRFEDISVPRAMGTSYLETELRHLNEKFKILSEELSMGVKLLMSLPAGVDASTKAFNLTSYVFFPLTTVATFFSTSFFDFQVKKPGEVSSRLWIFFVVTILLAAFVNVFFYLLPKIWQ